MSHFIGYPNLPDLLDAIDRDRPVNFIVTRISEPTSLHPLVTVHQYVEVSQVSNGAAHYWRKEVANPFDMMGKPDNESDWQYERVQSAEDAVQDYLRRRHYGFVRGSLDYPKDLVRTNGSHKGVMGFHITQRVYFPIPEVVNTEVAPCTECNGVQFGDVFDHYACVNCGTPRNGLA